MQTITSAAFYFVAHADDWQLFMAPEVSRDIADKHCKVVIVHVTAGDAGKNEKYWKARETAAIESLLFRTSIDDHKNQAENILLEGNKKIYSVTVNNCTCYFLRLPDGAYDGNGFVEYNNNSLEKLRNGSINSMASVDNQAEYPDWENLAYTIDVIINRELSGHTGIPDSDIWINIPEYDMELNPYDHNDHYNTSFLVRDTNAFKKYRKRAFQDYHIINNGRFLTDEDLFWKIGMFASYHQSLFRDYGHSTISEDKSMIPWCFRNSSSREL